MEIHLFENSLDFILSGIKHINSDKDYSGLKYAVLHLCSGLELLLKERLRLVNWSLVFNKVADASEKKYNSGDFTSVYLESALKRLEGICDIEFIESDKTALREFKKIRNSFEHFKVAGHTEKISGLAVKVVSIILKFIADNFDSNNFSAEANTSIDDIRKELQKLDALYNEHSKRIFKQHPEIDKLTRVECPKCYRDFLILGDGDPKCYYCSYSAKSSNIAKEYIENIIGISSYVCAKDGDEFPQYLCPDCGDDAMVQDSMASNSFTCFGCGEQYDCDDLSFCSSCGELYHAKNDEDDFCYTCWENFIHKHQD